jgi:hypothetical protein
MTPQYAGAERGARAEHIKLRYADSGGPIEISLPLEEMCGKPLPAEEIDTTILLNKTALDRLIDFACRRRGGFIDARWENGVGYRRLDISMDDFLESGIEITTVSPAVAKGARYA